MVEWQQSVPAAWCRCADGNASLLTCWLMKSQREGILCNGGVYTSVKQYCTPGFSGLCGFHGGWSLTLITRAVEHCVSLMKKKSSQQGPVTIRASSALSFGAVDGESEGAWRNKDYCDHVRYRRLGVPESCLHLCTLRNLSLVPRPEGWAAKSACSLFNAGSFSAVSELEWRREVVNIQNLVAVWEVRGHLDICREEKLVVWNQAPQFLWVKNEIDSSSFHSFISACQF